MRHLNYNHLFYFWTVAREGSIAKASASLHITPQTISGQLKLLEEAVGEPLFHRLGRGLELSDAGRMMLHYTDEIFSLGAELTQRVRGQQLGMPSTLRVGIVDAIPKLVSCRLLAPVLGGDKPMRLSCLEGDLQRHLSDIAVHKLDLVISDAPIPAGLNVKAYSHRLGESGIGFFVAQRQAEQFKSDFPASLNGVPFLMPGHNSALRRQLEDWFEQQAIAPNVVAEFDDSALLKAFGDAGTGVFAAPTVITQDVSERYGVVNIGEATGVTEVYYAISPERYLKHPAIIQITELARERLQNGRPSVRDMAESASPESALNQP